MESPKKSTRRVSCFQAGRKLSSVVRREGAFARSSQDTVTKSSGLIASFGNALMT